MASFARNPSSQSNPPTARLAWLAALAFALAFAGCAGCAGRDILAVRDGIEGRSEESIGAGLTQSVAVRASALLDGNDVEVRSVLMNASAGSIAITARICGLDYGGTLELAEVTGILKCAGYSSSTLLAAGDSVVTTDLMRIASSPGNYQLRVRHALQPEHWATVAITVR